MKILANLGSIEIWSVSNFFLNFSVSFSSILLRIPEQMTPAPSEVPQLSTVKWGQSKIVASMPVHCTLSIAKELVSKVPK